MTAVKTLRMIAAGERPLGGLLHTTRLEAFGVVAYGEEAIVEQFACNPLALSEQSVVIDVPGHIAIFDAEAAIIADLYGGNVARLWRLGGGEPADTEAGISVSFDPDLTQASGDVLFAATDHPELATDAVDFVQRAGRKLLQTRHEERGKRAYRARAFVVRAFGDATSGVVLFAVYRLTGDAVRESGFAMAAMRWTTDKMYIVRDWAGETAVTLRQWTPRIGN